LLFCFFKGRSIIYKDQGQILLLRLATDLEEFGKVEAMPVLEGKRMIMFIVEEEKVKSSCNVKSFHFMTLRLDFMTRR
jgi:translation initiation factor IF-3